MTFHFRNLPVPGTVAFLSEGYGWGKPPRRSRLIARWRRGTDGRLECRWVRQPTNFPPD
jgi:hypothetical protein